MKRRLWFLLLGLIAAGSGLVVLSGYFFPNSIFADLSSILLDWFVTISAFALIVGVLSLLQFQWKLIRRTRRESFYSWLLIITLLTTVAAIGIFGQSSSVAIWIMNYVLLPVESSLLVVLAIFLIYALARLFARRHSLFSAAFTATSVIFLGIYVASLWFDSPWLYQMKDWISQIWSLGAIRAILIGVALGAITTGIRILIVADRPYES